MLAILICFLSLLLVVGLLCKNPRLCPPPTTPFAIISQNQPRCLFLFICAAVVHRERKIKLQSAWEQEFQRKQDLYVARNLAKAQEKETQVVRATSVSH